jgi:hypothetical protein
MPSHASSRSNDEFAWRAVVIGERQPQDAPMLARSDQVRQFVDGIAHFLSSLPARGSMLASVDTFSSETGAQLSTVNENCAADATAIAKDILDSQESGQ